MYTLQVICVRDKVIRGLPNKRRKQKKKISHFNSGYRILYLLFNIKSKIILLQYINLGNVYNNMMSLHYRDV